MQALERIAALVERITSAVGRGVSWLALLMVLVAAANAVLRYLGRYAGHNLSSNAALELQWYLFSALFLLGAAWTLQQDRHVRVDVFYGRLSPRARAWIDLLGTTIFLLPFCALCIWVSFPSVAESWRLREQSIDPGGLPRYPVKTLLLVGLYLLTAQGGAQLVRHLGQVLGRPTREPGA